MSEEREWTWEEVRDKTKVHNEVTGTWRWGTEEWNVFEEDGKFYGYSERHGSGDSEYDDAEYGPPKVREVFPHYVQHVEYKETPQASEAG